MALENEDASKRKADHIDLAFRAQVEWNDDRFDYEPMLKGHPVAGSVPTMQVCGKMLRLPLWVSSMTGGAELAGNINRNLAIACKEFGMGMGLGSCRSILEDNEHLPDFAVRTFIGDQPLFANLGIAQVEQLLAAGKSQLILDLVHKLDADGLIVHVNPMQEWLQSEGDRIAHAPLDTIKRLLDVFHFPLIVKEVGQGFGPRSLKELAKLPLEAIDFGAQGGTNFSLLETLRRDPFYQAQYEAVAHIGHTAMDMAEVACDLIADPKAEMKVRSFIVSGGIKNFLDGYYFIQKIPYKTMYAHASVFLKYAMQGEEALLRFVEAQAKGLEMAWNYLNLRKK